MFTFVVLSIIGVLWWNIYRQYTRTGEWRYRRDGAALAWAFTGATGGSFIGIAGFGTAISGTIPGALLGYVLAYLLMEVQRESKLHRSLSSPLPGAGADCVKTDHSTRADTPTALSTSSKTRKELKAFAAMLAIDKPEAGNRRQDVVEPEPGCSPSATPREFAEIVEIAKKAALGDAEAQVRLGLMYNDGDGVGRDFARAAAWFAKAAAQGHAGANHNLAVFLQNGKGMPKDLARAFECYAKAAAKGNVLSQYNLACAYAEGIGTLQDQEQAVFWYEKAASAGYADAQFNLALHYVQGKGTPEDVAKAIEWCKKAASQGHADASEMLDIFFMNLQKLLNS